MADSTPAGPVPSTTGAPGTSGTAVGSGGPVLATVIVSAPAVSTQTRTGRARATVQAGDTSATSRGPYGDSGTEGFSGVALDVGGAGNFQPGSGRAGHHQHPNAGR